ncbi:histidinol-phosphatase [Litorihabitans aurantiacus]|uniref:Histidinol-phosphatase n=1 Tax=Litorihabitans aurantiacus TaxID=1930061 RepID=A0AA37XD96_9MICO|nr:histidinol-phosphatase [Litorihabitans aurantiacus]GMA30658.1 histidinol-phosphatase [Litorihabitans aurantiacus]
MTSDATAAGSDLADDLALALAIADALDAVTLPRFGALDLKVDAKPDTSPVSDADLAAERTARAIVAEQRPDDAVLGEEFGGTVAPTGRQWIIDPIDGTKNFVRGVPVWASLIGLAVDGEMRVGVVSAPALQRRWYAATGAGAHVVVAGAPARRLAVSGVADLDDASLSYASLDGWAQRGELERFTGVLARCWRTRGYGDFWSYMMVAEGSVDVAVEPELEVYDMAALVPIVTEAGGTFTSRAGRPGPWDGDALATNGVLHPQLLSALGR